MLRIGWIAVLLGACANLAADGDVRRPGRKNLGSTTADPTDPRTDPTDPSTTTPTTGTSPVLGDRRWDCSGLDPADPAPMGGKVALTFDDGPHLSITPQIVQTLRDYDAPATFFIVGSMLSDPDSWPLVEAMVEDPLFEIANHSYTHADLSSLSPTIRDEEFDDTTGLIETFDVDVRYFRFPYGASDCDAVDAARDRGMHVTGWHVDTVDWCYAAVGSVGTCRTRDYWRIPSEYENDMLGFTMEQVRRFNGGVILMHDIHQYTADSLKPLLDALIAEGYTFTSLDDLAVFPLLNNDNPADLPYLGEACNPLEDACWQIEYQSWCEPTHPDDAASTTGMCTLPCEGFCFDRPGAATTFCATVDPGAGQCVGRSASENAWCEGIEGTVETALDRWVGNSGVSETTADVCAPPDW